MLREDTIGEILRLLTDGFKRKTCFIIHQGRYIIKNYETNKRKIPRNLSERIARLLNFEIKYFYDKYLEFLEIVPIKLKKFRIKNKLPKAAAAALIETLYVMRSR